MWEVGRGHLSCGQAKGTERREQDRERQGQEARDHWAVGDGTWGVWPRDWVDGGDAPEIRNIGGGEFGETEMNSFTIGETPRSRCQGQMEDTCVVCGGTTRVGERLWGGRGSM